MKTQIKNLTSGTKNQIINPEKDYSQLPPASSHVGHSGSNSQAVEDTWNQVTTENPEKITIDIWNEEITLNANWSMSGKTCAYFADIPKEFLQKNTSLVPPKKGEPYISIQNANHIVIHNGKNSYKTICPSLVTIK
jgi:hypothetical protein